MTPLEWLRQQWMLRRWRQEQDRLKAQLIETDDFEWSLDPSAAGRRPLRLIGGLDISFFVDEKSPDDKRAVAALIVCEFSESREELKVVYTDLELVVMTEPYVAGFLAFREARHYQALLARLERARPHLSPDVLMFDGNGVLHPRGFGVASHVGVLTNRCSIGFAKNLHMVDGLDRETVRTACGVTPGHHVPLVGLSGRTWGAGLLPVPKKRMGGFAKKSAAPPKNPIFVSVGHRVSLDTCVDIVLACLVSARVPDPVREADRLSREEVRRLKEMDAPAARGVTVGTRIPSCLALAAAAAGLAVAGLAARRRRNALE